MENSESTMPPTPHPHHGQQRVLVIGGGRGGTAMLELFIADPMIEIVGIMDTHPQAPALAIAAQHGIRSFTDLAEAIEASRPCLAFNLTGDENVSSFAQAQLGSTNVIGGFQAYFLWSLLTRLKQTNDQIAHLAYHDALTGLPNRILFYDRLNQAITRAHRWQESFAVLYLDLDGFKPVNDMFGHDVGDALLREAAQRIVTCVRGSDTVARMGGDEFAVIVSSAKTPDGNDRVSRLILEAISRPFVLNGKTCSVSVSIGIALYPDNGQTAEQLVKISDAAMYLAKQSGKDCYRSCRG
ncbi:MAG: diguanylate cyclase [Betaproteobacteria bacterium]|nr:diguanylate cyclase [Betaproteobacteria bacterium]